MQTYNLYMTYLFSLIFLSCLGKSRKQSYVSWRRLSHLLFHFKWQIASFSSKLKEWLTHFVALWCWPLLTISWVLPGGFYWAVPTTPDPIIPCIHALGWICDWSGWPQGIRLWRDNYLLMSIWRRYTGWLYWSRLMTSSIGSTLKLCKYS